MITSTSPSPSISTGWRDSPRLWSRYSDGVHNAELARLHLALLLTLKGTPFLYNGEEIGMADLELNELSALRDTAAIKQYHRLTERLGRSPAEALKAVVASTRDRCRSPMQWSSAPNSGFSPPAVSPWLPVNLNYAAGVNVAAQERDPNSLLNFYRRLLHLRRTTPALTAGAYQALHLLSEDYFAFLRHDAETGQRCLVALNFSPEAQTVNFDYSDQPRHLLFSSRQREGQSLVLDELTLAPFEILMVELR